ncbi:MAG TPA: type I DNA topoisomerase [Dehalococcoidia bacterium]|nr:type I DNA topoisomerase [Dehalococcoidia bacterium]
MAKELVIVESPAKARTLGKIIGSHYSVKSSLGHVRDLPLKELGVDVKNGFAPKYVIPKGKKKVVQELKKASQKVSAVYLATDPDREGEAISWHLIETTGINTIPIHRVVFHEITEEAIKAAFRHPRQINMDLVNAQQARRVLDRLVGYKISPLLWRKIRRGLSAGRVQSVALRMIVEREREIQNFVPQEYWTIEAELTKKELEVSSFRAKLVGFKDKRKKLDIQHQGEAEQIANELKEASYFVAEISQKRLSRHPTPPFITSTLQQEAWRRLHFTAQRTMKIAQQLYEGLEVGEEGVVGLITYMRTDSTRVAETAVKETRAYIKDKYGADFLPPRPRVFTKKAKGAQEAHEAIRPTRAGREPNLVKPHLTADQAKLYELIWKRLVASQMTDALFDATTVNIEAKESQEGKIYLLKATTSVPHFLGFLTLYSEGKDEPEGKEDKALPPLVKGEKLRLLELFPEQHFTQPPPRYNEATLVKALEENGIGRPSTYAPTISTLRQRGYVERKEGRFYPLEIGLVVSDVLVEHFPRIVDIGFTAQMEEQLDEIARGEQGWVEVIQEFYTPFEETLKMATTQMAKLKVADQPTDEVCPQCGKAMVIRMGRYGKFLACTGFPKCKTTKPLPRDVVN